MALKDEAVLHAFYTPPRSELPFLAVTRLPTGDVSAVPFHTYEEAERHIETVTQAQTIIVNEVPSAALS